MEGLAIALAVFVCLTIISKVTTWEGFSDGTGQRTVRYGDTIIFWTNKSTLMRMNSNNRVDDSGYISVPEAVPRNLVWEFMTIERADDSRWRVGPTNQVLYGDKVYLRTWKTNRVRPHTNGTVDAGPRGTWEKLTLESADITGSTGKPVKFGDSLYLKTIHGTYIANPNNGRGYYTQSKTKEANTMFRIFDKYGQGQTVDWAARGFATQSSQYSHFVASNTINGNDGSFAHTRSEQNAWWQVELPRDISIDTIHILNRKDCCQGRLSDFDVTILDAKGTAVFSKHFKDSNKEYTISGINRTGRTVKVQLRGKNYLHLGHVKVFGTPIQYSSVLENQLVADLLSSETTLASGSSRQFHSDTLPYIGKNNAMSVSFFVKPESATQSGTHSVLYKGKNFQLLLIDGTLALKVTTAQGTKTIKAGTKPTIGNWNHIAVAVSPRISPATGWDYGQFTTKPAGTPANCCYIVNVNRKEYYHLQNQGVFADSTKKTWSASVVSGMKYMGELTSNVPTVTIYMNGRRDVITKLDADIALSNEPIVIGKTSNAPGFAGSINLLRMYNYAIDAQTVQRDSRSQHNVSTLELSRGVVNANVVKTIESHLLPTINPGDASELSVSFWLYSERGENGSGKWDQIFVKGNTDDEKAPGMWFQPAGNVLYAPIQVYGGTTAGAKEIKQKLKSHTWYHVAEVLKGREQLVYINGKRVSSIKLPGNVNYTISPIKLGGFAGKLKDFKFHNFALSSDEIKGQMGVHPDYKVHEELMKVWKEQGCVTDLFANPEENSDLIRLVKSGNSAAAEAKLQAIKEGASKGDAKKLVQCYGPYASKLFAKLQKSGELLKYSMDKQGKKCLPIAPFTCKTQDVNDFDIRTHKDFHKYTLTEKIIPPVQSLSDINIVDHPDFQKFNDQLQASKKALVEMTKLRVQSENSNKALHSKIAVLEKKQGLSKDDIVKHPLYTDLQGKLKAEQQKLATINDQQKATLAALKKADQNAQNVRSSPEYKRIAEELKNARKLAMSNIAQTMDIDALRTNPAFQSVLKEVMANTLGEKGAGATNMINLERDLRHQKGQLEQIRAQTMQQLRNTKQLANDIFHGIAGIDSTTIDNIIQSKQDLSDSEEYQEVINKVKDYAQNIDIKQHPEYQKLVRKLNQLTTGQVDGEKDGYQEFKVQAKKCQAMFESKQVNIPNETLIKMFKRNIKSDPQFKALAANILESTAASDPEFAAIMKKAQDQQYVKDPRFQEFLLKVTKQQLKNNPVYQRMVASMLGKSGPAGKRIIRLEDHPEYNKYADDMRRQKCRA